jgi:nitrogen regulatory protein PII
MRSFALLLVILDRDARERFMTFFESEGVKVKVQFLGKGTASREILSILGIGETEKLVLMGMLPASEARRVTAELDTALRMDQPGAIAFALPVRSLGGWSAMASVMGETGIACVSEEEKEEHMEAHGVIHFELLTVIINKGYVDDVMEAARAAGATGGTSIHAGGTRSSGVEKFFGISVQNDKEIVWIVVSSGSRAEIMKAIMHNVEAKAQAVVFSLPVTDVAGIHPRLVPALEK